MTSAQDGRTEGFLLYSIAISTDDCSHCEDLLIGFALLLRPYCVSTHEIAIQVTNDVSLVLQQNGRQISQVSIVESMSRC